MPSIGPCPCPAASCLMPAKSASRIEPAAGDVERLAALDLDLKYVRQDGAFRPQGRRRDLKHELIPRPRLDSHAGRRRLRALRGPRDPLGLDQLDRALLRGDRLDLELLLVIAHAPDL